MGRAHQALIHWSDAQLARGLPDVRRTIDPAWFPEAGLPLGEGWSLRCDFEPPPSHQGSPTRARVQFLVDGAPHERLGRGTVLQLLERATQQRARVEILD
jgi:hypothetical protein